MLKTMTSPMDFYRLGMGGILFITKFSCEQVIIYQRRGPNEIGSLSLAWKGFLGNMTSLLFYPPVVIALMHKIRGVKIKNIHKLYITFNVMIDNVYPE